MSLPVPDLDDRTFDQLVTEARDLIPRNFPAWTDHNLSDPFIALLELFAFLFEIAIYQTNRVPERSLERFAALVGVTRQSDPQTSRPEPIEQTLRRALEAVGEKARAVTAADFEFVVTKGIFFTQPALQKAHQAGATAVVMEVSPVIATLKQQVLAQRAELILSSGAGLSDHDLILLDDQENLEGAEVAGLEAQAGGTKVTLSSALAFPHDAGTHVRKIRPARPEIATALAAPSAPGSRIVLVEPLAPLNTDTILQLDQGALTEYIRLRVGVRVKVVVEVVPTPNVFPDEQIINVIIVRNDPGGSSAADTRELRETIFQYLQSRRLITTRVRVVDPDETAVRIEVTVVRDRSRSPDAGTLRERIERAIRDFLDPLTGGVDGTGWEFGRSIFRSELYQLIEDLAGVDHVRQLLLNGSETDGERRLRSPISLVTLDELSVHVVDA